MTISTAGLNTLLEKYFPDIEQVTISKGASGYNNTTRFIQYKDEKFVLRIYETHNDVAKVLLEHEILEKLKTKDLPFNIPLPILSKLGKTFHHLEEDTNKLACLFSYIKGDNPLFHNKQEIYSFGEQTGFLLNGLSGIKVSRPFAYKPYYEIENTHPQCTVENIVEWCTNPPAEFKDYSTHIQIIRDKLLQFIEYVPMLRKLPHQLIHGDLNQSNILVNSSGKISAILDFEFATLDLRAMEVAVCLSEIIIKESNKMEVLDKLRLFHEGFTKVSALDENEINALPVLVQLRRLDVFVHFLGRYIDGIDHADVLKEQMINYITNLKWMDETEEKLLDIWNGK